jgi:hypothetical protein
MQPTQIDPTEQWRPIPGYGDVYQVSSLGRVWSQRRAGSAGGLLRQIVGADGYMLVNPSHGGRQKMARVHLLVASAFHGPRPAGCRDIRHLDGDKLNNSAANLAYGTSSENAYDKVTHGMHHHAKKTHCPYGHPYDEANTYVRPSRPRARNCRACGLARDKAKRASRAA